MRSKNKKSEYFQRNLIYFLFSVYYCKLNKIKIICQLRIAWLIKLNNFKLYVYFSNYNSILF